VSRCGFAREVQWHPARGQHLDPESGVEDPSQHGCRLDDLFEVVYQQYYDHLRVVE
jgi:hypothetical protein